LPSLSCSASAGERHAGAIEDVSTVRKRCRLEHLALSSGDEGIAEYGENGAYVLRRELCIGVERKNEFGISGMDESVMSAGESEVRSVFCVTEAGISPEMLQQRPFDGVRGAVLGENNLEVVEILVECSLDRALQQGELLVVTNNIDGNFRQKSSSRSRLDALMYRDTCLRLFDLVKSRGIQALWMRTYLG